MIDSRASSIRQLTAEMRMLLAAASVLVFLAGVQLFLLGEQTDRYFAWTIQPPLTAVFLGAAYWASFLLEFLASRRRNWAEARVAVPAVFAFTLLTLLATLLHLDRFHFQSPDLSAQSATWIWLAIYSLVPPTMLFLWARQTRIAGIDSPRTAPLPAWMRAGLTLQAAVMFGAGVALFIAPQLAGSYWPWRVTPLTGRAIAAWLVGLGVFAAHATWENDFARIKVGMPAYAAFSVLQLVALGRYMSTVDWSGLGAWAYLFFILSLLPFGLYGLLR